MAGDGLRDTSPDLAARAAVHAALGEPVRLAIVDELTLSDRSPKELGERLGLPSNLLAHHLDVLERVGLVGRSVSAGDARRRYVHLVPGRAPLGQAPSPVRRLPPVLFVCTHNSARSQLAASLWRARTGRRATSAGTDPAERVHPGAVAAAERAGLPPLAARPRALRAVPPGVQVVTVCDRAHEELTPAPDWWHWSIPDPVVARSARAFDDVVVELEQRIGLVAPGRAGADSEERA